MHLVTLISYENKNNSRLSRSAVSELSQPRNLSLYKNFKNFKEKKCSFVVRRHLLMEFLTFINYKSNLWTWGKRKRNFLDKKPEERYVIQFWHDISRSCVARSEVSKWQPATVWISEFDVNSFWYVSTNLFFKEVDFESKKLTFDTERSNKKVTSWPTSKPARNVKSPDLLGKCSVHLSEMPMPPRFLNGATSLFILW